jgi:pimeloyl-ACP methyl ester carboxylesterase
MIGFTFDALVPAMKKPLLLMVGEKDDYPEVHFLSNVTNFAALLTAPAQGVLTIRDTGHSIHNERPSFLAHQVVNFASLL